MVNLDYLYNPAAAKVHIRQDHFLDKPLGFQVIENGMLLPHKDIMVDGKWTWGKGGLVDSKGEFVKSSHVFYGTGSSYTPPQNRFSTAPKPSSISDYLKTHGDML